MASRLDHASRLVACRQAPTQSAGFLADLDCTIIDVSCRDSELSEIPCGEPRKTGSPSSRWHEWNPFALRYRRAVCKFPAPFMVRYLTTNGNRSWLERGKAVFRGPLWEGFSRDSLGRQHPSIRICRRSCTTGATFCRRSPASSAWGVYANARGCWPGEPCDTILRRAWNCD